MSWVKTLLNWMTSGGKKGPGPGKEPSPVSEVKPLVRHTETVIVQVTFTKELVREAERFLGVHEVGGNNMGEAVERFQMAVDGKAQGEPWCAAFVQFCIKEVEAAHGPTVVVARSEHCMTIWNRTSGVHRYKSPKPGYLVIWNYEGTTNGHIGIVTKVIDELTIETIEGNTGPDSKTVEREGDGVYRKTRSTKTVGKMKLVGFIAPFNPDTAERPEIVVS